MCGVDSFHTIDLLLVAVASEDRVLKVILTMIMKFDWLQMGANSSTTLRTHENEILRRRRNGRRYRIYY